MNDNSNDAQIGDVQFRNGYGSNLSELKFALWAAANTLRGSASSVLGIVGFSIAGRMVNLRSLRIGFYTTSWGTIIFS